MTLADRFIRWGFGPAVPADRAKCCGECASMSRSSPLICTELVPAAIPSSTYGRILNLNGKLKDCPYGRSK